MAECEKPGLNVLLCKENDPRNVPLHQQGVKNRWRMGALEVVFYFQAAAPISGAHCMWNTTSCEQISSACSRSVWWDIKTQHLDSCQNGEIGKTWLYHLSTIFSSCFWFYFFAGFMHLWKRRGFGSGWSLPFYIQFLAGREETSFCIKVEKCTPRSYTGKRSTWYSLDPSGFISPLKLPKHTLSNQNHCERWLCSSITSKDGSSTKSWLFSTDAML